jgi:hypothetical protein
MQRMFARLDNVIVTLTPLNHFSATTVQETFIETELFGFYLSFA